MWVADGSSFIHTQERKVAIYIAKAQLVCNAVLWAVVFLCIRRQIFVDSLVYIILIAIIIFLNELSGWAMVIVLNKDIKQYRI